MTVPSPPPLPGPDTPYTAPTAPATLGADLRRIVPLAWPVLVGQVSVVAFGTVDTLLVARAGATDLAALAVGGAAYITVFIGLMGVVLAVGPLAGQLYGAGRLREAGHQLHQATWIALALSVLGSSLLSVPEPFLALAQASPAVADKVRGYLQALAFALPASLLFAAYRGFNTAVSRPKAVMALQLGGLALKVPLSTLLVFGLPAIGLPALGVVGCGIATAIAMWLQLLVAWWLLRHDRFYAPFEPPLARGGRWLARPHRPALAAQLRLGVPIGLTILVEVTGFSFMAIFIARLGTTAAAGHQIAANLVALMFMLPMSLGNATGVLVAQRIGAGALAEARRIGWHGVQIGVAGSALLGTLVFVGRGEVLGLYTRDPLVTAAALPLLAWVAVFHLADAAQGIAAFVLRAWRVATLPVVIFVTALWGVGLGGGYLLAFSPGGLGPGPLGAQGFWIAATGGLLLAAVCLGGLMVWTFRQRRA
jgi:MATE family multidrug resistance protein